MSLVIGGAAAGIAARLFWIYIRRVNAPPMSRMEAIAKVSEARLRAAEIPFRDDAGCQSDRLASSA